MIDPTGRPAPEKRIVKDDHVLIINRGGFGNSITRDIEESLKPKRAMPKKNLPDVIVCGVKKSFKKWR